MSKSQNSAEPFNGMDFNDALPQSAWEEGQFLPALQASPPSMDWTDFNDALPQESFVGQTEDRMSVEEVKSRLHRRLEEALYHLLPNGKTRRKLFVVGDVHGSQGESLSIELSGDKAGMWHDFATGEGGDIFSLWGAVHGWDTRTHFPDILNSVHAWLGTSIRPLPKKKNKIQSEDLGKPTAKWNYEDAEDNLIACIYRYDPPSGKTFRPWDVKARKHQVPDPRPLYNQRGIAADSHVVLVEGEKCADALIKEGVCATTAMGGANAPIDKTDWSSLIGKHVIVWADNDAPGIEYSQGVASYLSDLAASVMILPLPADKPEKWDAADAVAEGMDVKGYLCSQLQMIDPLPQEPQQRFIPVETYRKDTTPLAPDLVDGGIMIPGSLLLFAGAPKVGKTDFLLHWLFCMAAGRPFLGMNTPRPLKIAYLQTEIPYERLKDRIQRIEMAEDDLKIVDQNLHITPQDYLTLTEDEVKKIGGEINAIFPESTVDVIVIDPLRNVFDGKSENDNQAMMEFLKNRVIKLRMMTNPEAAIMLVHHTRKINRSDLMDAMFNALSGANSLRGFYDTGILMCSPDEERNHREIHFDLRHGAPIPKKTVEKLGGGWQEISQESARTVRKDYGSKLDRERTRIWETIVKLIREQAQKGQLHTPLQFAQAFINKEGLGGRRSIYDHIDDLCTLGYIKFNKQEKAFRGSKYGAMCVEGMMVPLEKPVFDPETGEIMEDMRRVLPTHFRDIGNGKLYPVENPEIWVYRESMTEITPHKKDPEDFEE